MGDFDEMEGVPGWIPYLMGIRVTYIAYHVKPAMVLSTGTVMDRLFNPGYSVNCVVRTQSASTIDDLHSAMLNCKVPMEFVLIEHIRRIWWDKHCSHTSVIYLQCILTSLCYYRNWLRSKWYKPRVSERDWSPWRLFGDSIGHWVVWKR